MTNFLKPPETGIAVKLVGKIEGYSQKRDSASFVFTKGDQNKMGVIAIAAAMAGLGGQAMATASNASAVEEEADYLEFSINGFPVKGWVWRSPFVEGDEVEIAAEWQGSYYEVFGIARPMDRMIALYPHCSRGRKRHIKTVLKWWFILAICGNFILMFLLMLAMFGGKSLTDFGGYITIAILSAFYSVMFFCLGRKWMPFVRTAEKIFKTLGWENPGDVDLNKTSKEQRKPTDSGEFGTFYFRY
jgi:hypothetical protein